MTARPIRPSKSPKRFSPNFHNCKQKLSATTKIAAKVTPSEKDFLNQSARLRFFPTPIFPRRFSELDKLTAPIENGKADVTFGSRALDRSLIGTHQPWQREQGGRLINLMIRKCPGCLFPIRSVVSKPFG
jgi:hypothetical protein